MHIEESCDFVNNYYFDCFYVFIELFQQETMQSTYQNINRVTTTSL